MSALIFHAPENAPADGSPRQSPIRGNKTGLQAVSGVLQTPGKSRADAAKPNFSRE